MFQYCREQNRKMLQNLYYQEDNFLENANCKLMDSFDEDVSTGPSYNIIWLLSFHTHKKTFGRHSRAVVYNNFNNIH